MTASSGLPRFLSSRIPLLVVFAALLMLTPQAQAAPAYQVEIAGAGDSAAMLKKFLDVTRRADSANLPDEEIQRLAASAPRQIGELLATEGYFSPDVRYEIDRAKRPWTIRYRIDRGPLTHVDRVDIRFSGAIADGPHAQPARIRALRRHWSLDAGEVFTQEAWSKAKSELLKPLLIQDFPTAAIKKSEAKIDPANASAALTVEIDSGPLVTFGELEIHGLKRYPRAMIDGVNPIRPGEPYSQRKLNELQSRLEDTGYFRSAFATVNADPAHPKRVPVRLDLHENPRRRLALGGGFSTDTGARLQAKWLDRDFLHRAWRFQSELLVDRETRLLGGDVFLPALANGWFPSFGAHFERTISAGETDDKIRTGGQLSSPDKLDEKVWGISYLADRQQIGDSFRNNRQALLASFTYTRRRLDNLLTPTRGYLASVELGAGPRGLINEDNIVRVRMRATWLKPLGGRWHSVLRGEVGQVFGGSRLTVPGDLLFRTGGDQTVRGYAYNTLGVEQDGAIVGGLVTAVASAELVYQFKPKWGLAVFTDAGNAADSWSQFSFKRGTGAGVRWRSPIGPVNVDLAYGHAVHAIRLHFSVGYGF